MNLEFLPSVIEYLGTMQLNPSLSVRMSWLTLDANIPDANKFRGLFSNTVFKEGEVICQYVGKELKTTEALRLQDKSYLMRLGEQLYIDAKDSPFCLARYINDCRNPAGYNVKFLKDPQAKCAWVIALRDICVNEEIFVDYGKWYWASSGVSNNLDKPSTITPIRLTFGQLLELRGIKGKR